MINKLKNDKAAGYDNITNEFIKAIPEGVRKILLRLMNTIYTSNLIPKKWGLCIITPILKEGPKKTPDNYRGICIGSALMKVLSTLMNQRLIIMLIDRKTLINHEQIGFKTNSRTADHNIDLKYIVNKYVTDQNGKKIYSWFIDLRKAFDTIWLNGLFHKLE